MLMFTFGNALARAHILYGVRRSTRPNVLSPSPVLLHLKTFCYTVCVCVSDAAPECVRLSHHRPGCGNQREDFPVFGFPAQHHRPDRRPWCEEPGISPMSRTEQRHPVDERLKTSNIFLILPGVAGRRRHALRLC